MAEEAPPYSSLEVALDELGVDLERRALIRRIVERIGVVEFRRTRGGGRITAIRRDGRRPLHILAWYVHGFASEAEARSAAGEDAKVWRGPERMELWGADYPGRAGRGQPELRNARHLAETSCPHCFLIVPAAPSCSSCGEPLS